MWTLMNILPNIAGELLKDNIHYLHFISLLEIFRLLNDDVYDENKIKRIEDAIYYYLLEFKVFFPNKKITPKQHFMVHYGRLIRQFGAPKTYTAPSRFVQTRQSKKSSTKISGLY